MKLHGNARTCLHSRSLLVRRVLEEGWTLMAAAEAVGVSVRTVSKWLARFRADGAEGLLDRSSRPAVVPHRTPDERVALVAAMRRLRMTAAEIAAIVAMPLSTLSAVATGAARAAEPLPAPPSRRAAAHRRQEARPDQGRRRQALQRRPPAQPQSRHRRRRQASSHGRVGVRPRLRRRRHPDRLRRSPRRRESRHGSRLPPPRGRPLPRSRNPGRAGDDR